MIMFSLFSPQEFSNFFSKLWSENSYTTFLTEKNELLTKRVISIIYHTVIKNRLYWITIFCQLQGKLETTW